MEFHGNRGISETRATHDVLASGPGRAWAHEYWGAVESALGPERGLCSVGGAALRGDENHGQRAEPSEPVSSRYLDITGGGENDVIAGGFFGGEDRNGNYAGPTRIDENAEKPHIF